MASEAQASATDAMPLLGEFRAHSATARAVTGGVAIERAGIAFESGVTLYTRSLNPRRAGELMARDGRSYAAAAVGDSDLLVELRRITEAIAAPGARVHGACTNGARATYVAVVYRAPARAVTMIVFAGDEPPSPSAITSEVCAVYGYAAPSGARTRDGVVLR